MGSVYTLAQTFLKACCLLGGSTCTGLVPRCVACACCALPSSGPNLVVAAAPQLPVLLQALRNCNAQGNKLLGVAYWGPGAAETDLQARGNNPSGCVAAVPVVGASLFRLCWPLSLWHVA